VFQVGLTIGKRATNNCDPENHLEDSRMLQHYLAGRSASSDLQYFMASICIVFWSPKHARKTCYLLLRILHVVVIAHRCQVICCLYVV